MERDGEEWRIAVKRRPFVGGNGKNGDHEVVKVLSPYLEGRGMLHGATRAAVRLTKRIAVIGQVFDCVSTLAEI